LLKSSLFLALGLGALACDADPAKGKPRASVAEPGVAVSAIAGATQFRFDQAGSSIEFVGAKVTRRHAGRFDAFRGTLQLLDADPTKSAVAVTIDTATLSADDDKLTRHLKSPDFFDVERFPKATFTSTSITVGGQDGATHTITGNLELHGVTKQITFPAQIKTMREAVEATAEFAINRKDFGIAYSGAAGDLIREQVLLMIKLRATRG